MKTFIGICLLAAAITVSANLADHECDYQKAFVMLFRKEISLDTFQQFYQRCFDPSNEYGFQPSCASADPETQAVAKIDNQGTVQDQNGNDINFHIKGVVSFQQMSPAQTKIVGVFTGLSVFHQDSDQFSLHVHQKGETNPSCSSTGGHFNPCGKDHSDDPTAENRHIGDVAKVTFVQGQDKIIIETIDTQVKLNGPLSVLGRSVTIHAGSSAARVGCAPITVTEWESGDRHPDTLNL